MVVLAPEGEIEVARLPAASYSLREMRPSGSVSEIWLALRLRVLGERERTVSPEPISSSKIEEQVDAKRLHRAEKLGLLPSGPQAEELGLVWNGRLPKDWRRKPNKESRRLMRRAARGDPVRRKAA